MKTTIAIFLVISMLALVGCQQASEPVAADHNHQAPVIAGEKKLSTQVSATNTNATPEITREAAEQIALTHAGLTADAVTRLHTEYDRDRINHYEVEFQHGRYEYSYEIHAVTGEILDFEREIDD